MRMKSKWHVEFVISCVLKCLTGGYGCVTLGAVIINVVQTDIFAGACMDFKCCVCMLYI